MDKNFIKRALNRAKQFFMPDWVPMGQGYSTENGVLRVRSTYLKWYWVFWFYSGLMCLWVWISYGFNWQQLAFDVCCKVICAPVCLAFWFGLPFYLSHRSPSLICTLDSVLVRDDYLDTVFDKNCLRQVELLAAQHSSGSRILVRLAHVARCACKIIHSSDSEGFPEYRFPDKRITRRTHFLKTKMFPFDAGVLAYAVATGEIDMGKQVLKEGIFNATST